MFSLLLCDRKVIEKTMEILFLCIVIFLFLLAVFDLSVGVSNDAVNFLNSAIGSKALVMVINQDILIIDVVAG